MKFDSKETQEKFVRAAAFAVKIGKLENLLSQIVYLETYAQPEKITEVRIEYDFAAHSFGFTILQYRNRNSEPERLINGGLIYHGPLENGEMNNNLSITMDKSIGWQTHT